MVSKRQMIAFTRALGRQIAAVRRRAGLSQEALAERLDSAKSVISRMESGGALPSITRLVEIADICNVDVREFFVFEGTEEDPDETERAATQAARLIRQVAADDAKLIVRVVEMFARRLRE